MLRSNVILAICSVLLVILTAHCGSDDRSDGVISAGESTELDVPEFGAGGGTPDSEAGGSADTSDPQSSTADTGEGTASADGDSDGADPDPDGSGQPSSDANEGEREDAATGERPGFEYPCEPGTKQACETSCESTGEQLCQKDWGPCIPPAEDCATCADDDCDGLINEDCPPLEDCAPPRVPCPTAVLSVTPGVDVLVGDLIELSAAGSTSSANTVASWQWALTTPLGSSATLEPSADVQNPTLTLDVAGEYLVELRVYDLNGLESCNVASAAILAGAFPPLEPEIGCADGEREGFLNEETHPQIAACAGAWSNPGVTPNSVASTCGLAGGDDGPHPDGDGCSSADLCAAGWHVCNTWLDVAAKSPTGCAGAVPSGAPSKSHFFAIRQPSENNIVCGDWGDGVNDVFGCGNLGFGLPDEKNCGPLDRALASTQPNTCGFNEAMPPLGPWECLGGPGSDLEEGLTVTKAGCPDTSCSYEGTAVANSDRGGVLCCRD